MQVGPKITPRTVISPRALIHFPVTHVAQKNSILLALVIKHQFQRVRVLLRQGGGFRQGSTVEVNVEPAVAAAVAEGGALGAASVADVVLG
nr:hypothetical protein Itr_chr12CG03480 [Ipomoea trifida]